LTPDPVQEEGRQRGAGASVEAGSAVRPARSKLTQFEPRREQALPGQAYLIPDSLFEVRVTRLGEFCRLGVFFGCFLMAEVAQFAGLLFPAVLVMY
jgi:hypothetical protein